MRSIKIKSSLKKIFLLATIGIMLQSFYVPNIALWAIKAGVTIPANQEFVLGEYKHPDYRSIIENKSGVAVVIELRNRRSNEVTQSLILNAGESIKVNVSKVEMVVLKNSTDSEILIKVKANRNVKGMRYQEIDAYED